MIYLILQNRGPYIEKCDNESSLINTCYNPASELNTLSLLASNYYLNNTISQNKGQL